MSAWLWNQIDGIVQKSRPRVSAQTLRLPAASRQAPCAQLVPRWLLCVSYEVPFPEPSSHWDPREATALPGAPGFERVWTGLGALNRLFSSVVLLGEMG